MRVYKFGGASIADAGKMAALMPIIGKEPQSLMVVMSAYGKTTNALEAVVKLAVSGQKQEALAAASEIISKHLDYARNLLDKEHFSIAKSVLQPFFTEFEEAVNGCHPAFYDYSYDQVVGMGELFSTLIFSVLLQQQGIPSAWVDVRTVLKTDETYRDAVVDWTVSQDLARKLLLPRLRYGEVVVVQGFIGATSQGKSVTLGREGSDYTAAIMAAMLGMESVTIWKDVNGLQNADPKQFADTVKIESITYNEVIEMAFYGAQIIHPKTIKPLQNAGIPLYVKCFLDPTAAGSVIRGENGNGPYPPLIVWKDNQVLVQVTTRDFSFITEDNLSRLYSVFHDLKVKINLIQNAAISFFACVDNREEKVRALVHALGRDYKVAVSNQVHLLTVRHYTDEVLDKLTTGRQFLLRQETQGTIQAVLI